MSIYGASLYQSRTKEANFRYDVLGKDSEVMAIGDPLTVSSGVLKVVAAATDQIWGISQKVITAAQMGATNDTVYPPYVPANPDDVWFMGTNSDLTDNETDAGTYYGLSGSTGAVVVNVSGGVMADTSRQVMIVKVDPYKKGGSGAGSGLRECLVRFVMTKLYRQPST